MEYRFNYNVTGPNRKRLVEAIAEIHGGTPRYLGAPTFSYEVDCFTVSKDGAVTFDSDRTERDAVKALVEGLERLGFEMDAAQGAADAPVTAIPATEALTRSRIRRKAHRKPLSRKRAAFARSSPATESRTPRLRTCAN